MEFPLRSIKVVVAALLLSVLAQAQQIDASVGASVIKAPAASTAVGSYSPQSLRGGLYPAVAADVLLKHWLGVGAEVSWRAHSGLYAGYQPFRPLLYDVNAVFAPSFGRKSGIAVQAGLGEERLAFSQGSFDCGYFTSCATYADSSHLLVHIGFAFRYYAFRSLFVSPDANLYFIHDNTLFSSGHAQRYGISIGYSFRREH
jgi:hypothetical protein